MSVIVPALHGIIGGVFAPTPPNIGNRVMWWSTAGDAGGSFLDVAATVPAGNNGRVAAIRTAAGDVFSQSDATNRPLLRFNEQNNLPGLFFESARNDRLVMGAPISPLLANVRSLGAMTVLLIWKPGYAGDHCALHFAHNQDGLRLGVNTSNRVRGFRHGNLSADDEAIMFSAQQFSGAAAAVIFTFNGFGSTFTLHDNFGNSDSATADSGPDGNGWEDGYIGAAIGNHDNFYGNLYEILIWDAAASGGQRTSIFAYATAKWGLT